MYYDTVDDVISKYKEDVKNLFEDRNSDYIEENSRFSGVELRHDLSSLRDRLNNLPGCIKSYKG